MQYKATHHPPRMAKNSYSIQKSAKTTTRKGIVWILLALFFFSQQGLPGLAVEETSDSQELVRPALKGEQLAELLSLERAGSVDRATAHYQRAEKELTHALNLAQKAYGKDDAHLATIFNRLGELYANTNRTDLATTMFGRALKVNAGKNELTEAETFDHQANLLIWQGQARLAAEPAEKALTLRQRNLPVGHQKIAESLNTAALVSLFDNNLTQAEQNLRNALTLTAGSDAPKDLERARSLDLLARVYVENQSPQAARPLAVQALEIRQRVFGKKHPLVAESFLTLGSINMQLSAFHSAEDSFRSALRIFQDFGNLRKHETVLATFAIAFALAGEGKYNDSKQFFDQAMLNRAALSSNDETLETLKAAYAHILWEQKNWSEAFNLSSTFLIGISADGEEANLRSLVSGTTKKPKDQDIFSLLMRAEANRVLALSVLAIVLLTMFGSFASGLRTGFGISFLPGPMLSKRARIGVLASRAERVPPGMKERALSDRFKGRD